MKIGDLFDMRIKEKIDPVIKVGDVRDELKLVIYSDSWWNTILYKWENSMEISAEDVKKLRERTSAGIMDCKTALIETNCDIDKAVEYLRKKGLEIAMTAWSCISGFSARTSAYVELRNLISACHSSSQVFLRTDPSYQQRKYGSHQFCELLPYQAVRCM